MEYSKSRVANNIRCMAEMHDRKIADVEKEIGLGTGNLSRVINGKGADLRGEVIFKACAMFDANADVILNDDLSDVLIAYRKNKRIEELKKELAELEAGE